MFKKVKKVVQIEVLKHNSIQENVLTRNNSMETF
jgi:hypothetical protein